jgi:hypothetical protein
LVNIKINILRCMVSKISKDMQKAGGKEKCKDPEDGSGQGSMSHCS